MALRPGTAQKEQRAAIEASANPDDDNHAQLVRWYEDAEEATRDARQLSERDRDYYDNKQLTPDEIQQLRLRGQPEIIINKIQTKVNFLLGYEAQQRTDPRGFPRNPADEEAAGACSDALRYIKDNTHADRVFSDVWENIVVEGFGGCELSLDTDENGESEITLTHVPWDRLFYDPHSRRDDFSDARYKGIVIWMDYDDALALWPDGEDALSKTFSEEFENTYEDRPTWKQWAMQGNRKRVRIVQMYYRDGAQWHWCILTKGGKLASGPVPFYDDKGRGFCPLLMQSAFVDRENNRYGFVRALISTQDEINKRRSRLLHMAMGRPFVTEEGAVEDIDEAKREMRKPDGAIRVNPGARFEILDTSVEVAGHAQLLQHATNEIELQGPNAVMQGKGERNASGRAKLIDQQGGQTEVFPLMDNLGWLKTRFYQSAWSIVRQEWTGQKWVRVTDDEKKVRFVGFNRPVTVAEDLLKQAIDNGVPEEEAKAQLAQQAQDPRIRFQMEQVARLENVPAEMHMDIIIEEVPDTANLQQEQFEILAQLAQAGIVFPPKVYIRASALRDKDQLIDELEEQQSDPAQQAAAKAEIDKMMAEVEKTMTEVEKLRAEIAETKTNAIKNLAQADAEDKQAGQIVNPEIRDAPGRTFDLESLIAQFQQMQQQGPQQGFAPQQQQETFAPGQGFPGDLPPEGGYPSPGASQGAFDGLTP